jgi:hypothetical protein
MSNEPSLPRCARRASGEREVRALRDWRSEPAYVLLGDPGAGKSTSFKDEAHAQAGLLVEASDIADGVADTEGLSDRVVFIDGFDQIKANSRALGTGALGSIRAWLAKAKPAGFRLSCREADWLGEAEQDALARVAPQGQVTVLQLEPLTQDEAMVLLQRRECEIGDARAFWLAAEQRQLTPLFGNPLLLDLMVDAVSERGGEWPRTRTEVYEAACERLMREASLLHLAAQPQQAGRRAQLLHTAGLLSALLLLSGKSAIALQRPAPPQAIDLAELPPELGLPDALAALATKVFIAPGGLAQPRHRSIAEYLAARALAQLLSEGPPLGRVLALMQGFDGQPVEALRGLLAWLVVEHLPSRSRLLQLDPLGFVLNGDPARLSTSQRLELLQALAGRAAENPWFRQGAWISHPFGPLATADMAGTYEALLNKPERDMGHQAFIDCVLDALCHGETMPSLAPALAAWVEDDRAFEGNRSAALQAWRRHCPEVEQPAQERAWLVALKAGSLSDPADRLLGAILFDAYPERVAPEEVLDYLRPRQDSVVIGRYTAFWQGRLLERARPGDAAVLVEQWLHKFPRGPQRDVSRELRGLSSKLLARALQESGDAIPDEKLHDWLALGQDEHGFHRPAPDSLHAATVWLQTRPERLRAVLKLGYSRLRPDAQGRRYYWQAEERLLGAQLPRDLPAWLLALCAESEDANLARHCFGQVVAELVTPSGRFDMPSLRELEVWAEQAADAARPFADWLAELLAWPLDHHKGRQHRRHLQDQAEHAAALVARRVVWAPLLPTLGEPAPHVGLMHEVAQVMLGRHHDVCGDTPLEKVQDLLGADPAVAGAALAALDRTLQRSDIPSRTEIFALANEGREFLLQALALLAAERAFIGDPQAPLLWSDSLSQTLVAFYLCDGLGSMPLWYRWLVRERPTLVAPVFIAYARPRLGRKRPGPPNGVWALAGEEEHQALVNLVLPELLKSFPARTNALGRHELERSLLAALPRLPAPIAAALVAGKLADPALSPLQRLSWRVADLRYCPLAIDDLVACVAGSRPRRLAMGVSLHLQGLLSTEVLPDEPRMLRALLELLAPVTPRRLDGGSGWVGPAEEREDLVRALFNRLARHPSDTAREALRTLAALPDLHDWQHMADYSLHAQRSVARQSRFQVPSPQAVALALANRAPAHQADLQALLFDHLDTITAEIRGANSSALRQFWADDGSPRDENECRDLLLEKLRVRLEPLGILVEPEVAAANLKRMDLKLTFAAPGRVALSLPVEAKKDSHKDLWTAWREQLQRLYAIEPRAAGHGVYLVFWFGHRTRCKPGHAAPHAAAELRLQLEAELDEQARQSISIYVLDLSWPQLGAR